jgi:spore germination cell wall hydrolase CwlJ-like protein
MMKMILAAAVAASGLALGSALVTRDGIVAAPAAVPAALTAADIVVDPARIDAAPSDLATSINPHAGEPLVAEQPAAVAAVPAPSAAAAVPSASVATSLAAMVAGIDHAAPDEELRCLASAVWHEAKSEGLAGQLAVAKVIVARRDSGRFARTLCGVVAQPGQFSFVRGRAVPTPPEGRQWRQALAISRIAMADDWESPVEGALFFHARRVNPGWRLTRMGAVENHVFYR